MKTGGFTSGAALRVLPLIFPVVFLASGIVHSQEWIEYRDIPAASEGNIIFHVDVVSFYEGNGKNTEEIYTIIANDQIRFIEKNGSYNGKLRYRVSVRDQNGKPVESADKMVDVSAQSSEDAEDRNVVQVLQSKMSVPPGIYKVAVSFEDLNAIKKTLLSRLFKRYRKGEVTAVVESKRFENGQIGMSDIEFARSLRRTSEEEFQKSGFEVIPNAQRRYGLLLPEMAVFFEAYDLRTVPRADTVNAVYSIINKAGGEVFRNEKPMVLRGQTFANTALFDVTSLAAGSYILGVTLTGAEGNVLARSERKFDVAWSPVSWGKYESEKAEDMTFVFTDSEMKTFKSLSPGEQEQFLQDFWRKLDPTYATVDNEALGEHYRRVAYADEHYGTAGVRGALTDRGRIYIKYGPPDDIETHFADYEFVRDKRDMEGAANPALTDPFSRVGIKSDAGEGESGTSADVYSDQRGGTTVHGKSYETWIYEGTGNPVRRLSERLGRSPGMRFIFADEKGIGDYRVIYSTEKQEY